MDCSLIIVFYSFCGGIIPETVHSVNLLFVGEDGDPIARY